MTKYSGGSNAETLRGKICAAFPDSVFSGPITLVDGDADEVFDEEQELYGALHGKKWSEIPPSFIHRNAYATSLLTAEALSMFLPAWLIVALDDEEVRHAIVFAFSKERPEEDTSFKDRKVQRLSGPQREALCAFLGYVLEMETEEFMQDRARSALEYVSRFCEAT